MSRQSETLETTCRALLDWEGVLAAVVATADGLVVAAAGLTGEDAEVLAVAGATLAQAREPSALAVDGGTLHVVSGSEIVLVALTEPDLPAEVLAPELRASLCRVGAVADGAACD